MCLELQVTCRYVWLIELTDIKRDKTVSYNRTFNIKNCLKTAFGMILLGMGRLSDKCIKSEVELFIISAIVCRLAGILGVRMFRPRNRRPRK